VLHLNLQRLEDTAELGRALISRLPGAGLLIVDADLRILRADGDVHRDLPADIVGKRVDDVIPAEAWVSLEPRYRAALEGELQAFDFDFDGLDGVTVHSLRFAPIRDDANVIGVMVLSDDITARVTAVRRLADSERMQRSVLEVLDEGVLVVRADGVLLQANPTACAILGVELAPTLADPSWWRPVHARRKGEDSGSDVGATVMKTGEGVRDVALEISQPDGTIVSLSANYQALRDEDGAISGLVISFRDLSDRDREHRRLAESQEHLREAHQLARLSSWEWRPETNEVVVFHAAAPEDEALVQASTPLEDVLAGMPEDARQVAREDLATIARGERDTTVQRHRYGYEAGPVWIETRLRAIRDDEGALLCVRGTSQDVTDQELARQEATTQAALLEEVDVAVVATDPAGRITHWNRGARQLHGWTHEEMVGRDAAEFLGPADATLKAEVAGELDRSGHWEGEYTVRHKDGSAFPAYLRARVMLDADGERAGWIGVSVDLTKRLESERALRTAGNYLRAVADSVGDGLFTLDTEGRVTYMNAAAERHLGWSRDELLGRVMRDVARARDSAPAEEWPVLNARRAGSARRIDDVFVRRDGCDLPVAYSAAPFETDDGVQGCVVVFEDISERRAHEAELEEEARKLLWIGRIQDALAEDRFVLYAQPIVDVRGGEVVQSELLLRLREPGGEIVAPGEFLQIAEDYGLIGDIDRWVITRGAEIAATGRPVEVNLSAHSVGDAGVLVHIEHCLERSGADPTLLVFEITETALIQDEVAARRFAERLHELGCKLALDDFGTGYGGFTYLKQLPLDFLKIDIEFVRDLATNPASSHVVRAVVALAHGFGLQTVAEGVEDAATLALLRELGVDLAQGYHIARPGPLAAPGTPDDG
jgi:PAS domain S-box-containing protein